MYWSNWCFFTGIQISQETRNVVWYSISLIIFHSLLWSTQSKTSIVNEAEVDDFLKFLCFLCDPMNVGNLISGYSAFSKPNLYIWKLLVHLLLKPSLEDFEHNLTHLKWVCLYGSLYILWHCPSLGLKWKLAFSSGLWWVFHICWHTECNTFNSIIF